MQCPQQHEKTKTKEVSNYGCPLPQPFNHLENKPKERRRRVHFPVIRGFLSTMMTESPLRNILEM